MSHHEQHDFIAPKELFGLRLDQALAQLLPQHSRSRLKQCIVQGNVLINKVVCSSPKEKILGGEAIQLLLEALPQVEAKAENLVIDFVYQDEHIAVINKPAGVVVHPGAGNHSGTLLNGLLHYFPEIDAVPRAGIVHRLDKETTGLMVIAKTLEAHTALVAQLQRREVIREYEAICHGPLTGGGTIDEPLARHPQKRTHIAVVNQGKPAVTHYRLVENFRNYSRIRLRLETGRTHQIRVHMAYIRHSLLGDPVYGTRLKLPKHCSPELTTLLRQFNRQALHAIELGLTHPITQESCHWSIPLPTDMQQLMAGFEQDKQENG